MGDEPYTVTVEDFNGDGKPDLASANFASDDVSVLMNTTVLAEGPLAFYDQESFGADIHAFSVAVADINEDGKHDFVSANIDSDTVSVLLNTTTPGASAPSFAARQEFGVGDYPNSVAVADFNGDGKTDVASANNDSFTISVLLNTTTPGAGTPSFTVNQEFGTGDSPYSVVAADFNGDGRPDLACANFQYRHRLGIVEHDRTRGEHSDFYGKTRLRRRQQSIFFGSGGFQWGWQARFGEC